MFNENTINLLRAELEHTISAFLNDKPNNSQTMDDCIEYVNISILAEYISRLGFKYDSNPFTPNCYLYPFLNEIFIIVGTQRVYLTKVKTYKFLVEEILMKVKEELVKVNSEYNYLSELIGAQDKNISLNYDYSFKEDNEIENMINYISRYREADENFVNILTQLGYTLNYKSYCGIKTQPFISLDNCPNTNMIWLVESNKLHTIFAKVHKRKKLEILYLLVCIMYKECLFADEM